MRKAIKALVHRVRPPSVARALLGLDRAHAKLVEANLHHLNKSDAKAIAAKRLEAASVKHRDEASRAARVADRIRAITE